MSLQPNQVSFGEMGENILATMEQSDIVCLSTCGVGIRRVNVSGNDANQRKTNETKMRTLARMIQCSFDKNEISATSHFLRKAFGEYDLQ